MGNLQPKLRFPEFEGDWKLKKINDTIKSIDSGWSPQCEDYSSDINEWGVLKTTSVVWEGFNENENKKLPIKLKPKENIEVFANDILITRAGPTNRVGVSVHVDRVRPKLMLSDKLIRLRTNENYSSKFISILLSLENIKNQIVSKSSGLATSQTNISQNILLNVKLSVPLFEEQAKIANFLSSIDEKINLLKEKKALLEEYKKGMIQKIFNREIRFKDGNGNDFEDWEEKTLGEIGEFQTSSVDKLIREGESEVFLVNYMNVYKHENINNESKFNLQIVTAKENQIISTNLKKGDILFTPSSETPDDIGHSVVIFEDLDNCVYSYHLMRFRPKIKIDIMYSHYFCNNSKVLSQLSRLATGSTRVTISVKSFSSINVDLPCLKEQTKIANFLSAIDEKITLVATQIEDTQEYKKGLLQQMFV